MPSLLSNATCATIDRIGEIRKELGAILPGTQIIEHDSKALARAEARTQTKATAERQIAIMRTQEKELRDKREQFAGILIPFVAIACMAGIALLTFLNVRERLFEVGLLLSMGVQVSKILMAFLAKAIISGFGGAVLGVGLALALITMCKDRFFSDYDLGTLLTNNEIIMVVVLVPLLSAVAAWLPSFWASQIDPAKVLRHD